MSDDIHSDRIPAEEAARYLGVTRETLSVWRCLGRYNIPFVKMGRLVQYRRADLDAFIASRTTTSTTQLATA